MSYYTFRKHCKTKRLRLHGAKSYSSRWEEREQHKRSGKVWNISVLKNQVHEECKWKEINSSLVGKHEVKVPPGKGADGKTLLKRMLQKLELRV